MSGRFRILSGSSTRAETTYYHPLTDLDAVLYIEATSKTPQAMLQKESTFLHHVALRMYLKNLATNFDISIYTPVWCELWIDNLFHYGYVVQCLSKDDALILKLVSNIDSLILNQV